MDTEMIIKNVLYGLVMVLMPVSDAVEKINEKKEEKKRRDK